MRLLTLGLLAAVVVPLGAQDSAAVRPRTAAIAGRVRDPQGHPIKEATLSVDGRPLRAVTNDSGIFFLGGVPAGRSQFSLTKVGYAPVNFEITLSPDTTLMINLPMRTVQALATVDVTRERVSPPLGRDGYYERKQKALGSFLGPEKLDSMSYVSSPAQFLRDTRGVEVRCRSAGRCTVSTTRRDGCLAVFVNKNYIPGQLDDAVSPDEVYAIEVYERKAIAPIEFALPSRMRDCGVIAVWTKGYAVP